MSKLKTVWAQRVRKRATSTHVEPEVPALDQSSFDHFYKSLAHSIQHQIPNVDLSPGSNLNTLVTALARANADVHAQATVLIETMLTGKVPK
jgi:hypothetical protein